VLAKQNLGVPPNSAADPLPTRFWRAEFRCRPTQSDHTQDLDIKLFLATETRFADAEMRFFPVDRENWGGERVVGTPGMVNRFFDWAGGGSRPLADRTPPAIRSALPGRSSRPGGGDAGRYRGNPRAQVPVPRSRPGGAAVRRRRAPAPIPLPVGRTRTRAGSPDPARRSARYRRPGLVNSASTRSAARASGSDERRFTRQCHRQRGIPRPAHPPRRAATRRSALRARPRASAA
jgi:hypothetical protein